MTKTQVDRVLGENPILGIVYGPGYVDWKCGISGIWVLFDDKGRVVSVSPGKPVVFLIPFPVAPPPRAINGTP
jgi:hypothetical protein